MPTPSAKPFDTEKLAIHVDAFRAARPRFEEFGAVLLDELRRLAHPIAPGFIIEGRAKTVASFAEKLLRKPKYADPLRQVTDLFGARVVVMLPAHAEAVCKAIEGRFVIDRANSLDQRSRLSNDAFGYRSVHFVVQLNPENHAGHPAEFFGLKAEVQVRTCLQHAWSSTGHDCLYKGGHPVPEEVKREAARIAARLESTDADFQRMMADIEDCHAHSGKLLDKAEREKEARLQETLRRFDPDNPAVPLRQAELAIAEEKWECAIAAIEDFQRTHEDLPPALLSALGYAHCQNGADNPQDSEHRKGRTLLRQATAADPHNVVALLRLGEAELAAHNRKAALDAFSRAYAEAPNDPAVLAGFIRAELLHNRQTRFIPLLRPTLQQAIARCQRQAQLKIELPAARFREASFRLLLGGEAELSLALQTLCRALVELPALSSADATAGSRASTRTPGETALLQMLEGAEVLRELEPGWASVDIVVRFLHLALAARSQDPRTRLGELGTPAKDGLTGRALIIAGDCDPQLIDISDRYRPLLAAVLAEFSGTVISGGTVQGVAGLVGELGSQHRGRIRTVGYLPRALPHDADRDRRYDEIRYTAGDDFSALQVVQAWIDLLASGVQPAEVTLLGLGGGAISAFEYRLALALGARVGVVLGSGRAADALCIDPEWQTGEREFIPLPCELLAPEVDVGTLRAFLHPAVQPRWLTDDQLGQLGKAVHTNYLRKNLHSDFDPVRAKWDVLRPDLRHSNEEQILYASEILATEGYELVPAPGAPETIPLPEFSKDELERMAELEHGRWNVERLRSGWRPGEKKDPIAKINPSLTPWKALSDETKGYDRVAIRDYAEHFRCIGYAVRKVAQALPAVVAAASSRKPPRPPKSGAKTATRPPTKPAASPKPAAKGPSGRRR